MYKQHLVSQEHAAIVNGLIRKHGMVLQKIRTKQRSDLKASENKWKEENLTIYNQGSTR